MEAMAFNDWPAAIPHYQDCLAAYQQLGDAGAAARVAFSLGLAQHLAGQADAALLRLDEARRCYAALGDGQGVAESQYQIAVVHARREDWPQAEAYLLETARRFGDLGDALESMVAWRDLATIETELGKTGEGFRYLTQALNLSLSLGPLVWPTTVVHSLEVARRALEKGAASEVLAGAQGLAAEVSGSRALTPPEREALSKVYAALQTLAEARSPELAEPQRSQRGDEARALAREADAATGGTLGVENWVEDILET
jgi:tetratricopeptide (TPR) repeat protein